LSWHWIKTIQFKIDPLDEYIQDHANKATTSLSCC
jgi:hypothetical protein